MKHCILVKCKFVIIKLRLGGSYTVASVLHPVFTPPLTHTILFSKSYSYRGFSAPTTPSLSVEVLHQIYRQKMSLSCHSPLNLLMLLFFNLFALVCMFMAVVVMLVCRI